MKKIFTLLFVLVTSLAIAQTSYNDLLTTHVDKEGNVDYKGLKDNEASLHTYLQSLENTSIPTNWSEQEEKAFWINAYNAYTLKIILDNYPIISITKISNNGKTAWKTPFAKVAGETYTLDHIEHEILRKKFSDPRIHVGVNCASVSCPKLANFAFNAENIEAALEVLMSDFINDSSRNKITKNKVQISEIFNWFQGDFTANGNVIDYLNKYSNTLINKKAKIKYLTYDWNLNGK